MNTLLRIPLLISLALCLTACGPRWIERHVPTTVAERQAILAHVEHIMERTPKTLSGHDQDWDDAIKAANETATQTICRTTYWELTSRGLAGYEMSGRWRYAEEAMPPAIKP